MSLDRSALLQLLGEAVIRHVTERPGDGLAVLLGETVLQLLVERLQKEPETVPSIARHSPDFRSVHWFGADYTFTPTQAMIVGQLWESWEGGASDVGHERLLENAGSESHSLRDLFRGHDAWRTMVVSVRRGTYRLNKP